MHDGRWQGRRANVLSFAGVMKLTMDMALTLNCLSTHLQCTPLHACDIAQGIVDMQPEIRLAKCTIVN